MKSRLVIDGLPFLGSGGISNYVRPLVEALAERWYHRWDIELLLRLGMGRRRARACARWGPAVVPGGCAVRTSRIPDRLFAFLWKRQGVSRPPATRTDRSVFLATTTMVPKTRAVAKGWIVYDLTPIKIPEFYPGVRQNFFRTVRANARRADFIVAISRCTRADVVQLLGYPEDRVAVIYPGLSMVPPTTPARQPGFPAPYILGLGSLALNKNTDGLLRIFARCVHEHHLDMELVLAGKDFCGGAHWRALAERLGISKRLRLLGWVTETQRWELLRGASMLWQFSWYEGFGLPVLEAAACGTPVLLSNRGALPEILQNPEQEIDPSDEAGAAERAAWALKSPAVLEAWRAHGLKRSAGFSWARSADQLAEAVKGVLS